MVARDTHFIPADISFSRAMQSASGVFQGGKGFVEEILVAMCPPVLYGNTLDLLFRGLLPGS